MATKDVFLAFALWLLLAACQSSTTIVTATTTVTATESGACNDFVGACVVYGAGDAAPYTTTVDTGTSETVAETTVTAPQAPGTTGDAGNHACSNFNGACVVYDGTGDASHTTTASSEGSNDNTTSPGDSDGYIAAGKGGDGYIGEGATISMGVAVPLISFVLVNVGFFVLL